MSYYDKNARDIERGVSRMHGHKCTGTVACCDDQSRLVFGWKCSCGEEWMFKLMSFKLKGMGCIWREEMRTQKGRAELIYMAKGVVVPRNER